MAEPPPLGITNVMFSFMCLSFGIGLSLIQVLAEFSMHSTTIQTKKRLARKSEQKRESRRRMAARQMVQKGMEYKIKK